jgi:hypothetical protein
MARLDSSKRLWLLAVSLSLLCVGFWSVADLFHEETGIESDRDCPICQLERVIASGAPLETPIILVPQPVPVLDTVACQLPGAPLERRQRPCAPRGPPSPA